MAKDKATRPLYSPLPLRAILDPRLTPIDLRTLLVIAAHDRLSDPNGTGQGCWARQSDMARKVGCHYTNLSTAIKRLTDFGYIRHDRQDSDKRLKVYRVLYVKEEDALFFDKVSAAGPLQPIEDEAPKVVCPDTNQGDEIVCPVDDESQTGSTGYPSQYIPQNGVIDSVETEEIDSAKAARLKSRLAIGIEEDSNPGATLAMLERAVKSDSGIDITPDDAETYLEAIGEAFCGEPEGHQAGRILENIFDATENLRLMVWERITPMNRAGKEALAKQARISAAELVQFANGNLDLNIAKQAALRSATKRIAA